MNVLYVHNDNNWGGNDNIYLLFIVKIILKLKLTLKTATVTAFFIDA